MRADAEMRDKIQVLIFIEGDDLGINDQERSAENDAEVGGDLS